MSILRRVIRKLRKPPEIQGPVKIIVNGQEHLTVTGQTVLQALRKEDIGLHQYRECSNNPPGSEHAPRVGSQAILYGLHLDSL